MMRYILVIICCLMMGGKSAQNEVKPLSYLALGDSYTIGESVKAYESFPFQLQRKLNSEGLNVSSPRIIARTGWTTRDLLNAIECEKPHHSYSFVTLLIGVNNQYRGYSLDAYRKEFNELLHMAIQLADNKKECVFVISIPDWGVTDYAKQNGFNPSKISQEIDMFNTINKEEALEAGVSYTYITANSRLAKTDASLIANDGLHPSAKMYTNWADNLAKKIFLIDLSTEIWQKMIQMR